jgi:very-short-patch-repair endonuclease
MRRETDHAHVRSVLAALGGIAPARDLVAAGIDPDRLRMAVEDRAILRFRKGWYAVFELAPDVIRASRVGGVLTCVSAARHHGLWVPDDDRLHVAVARHSSRLRSPHDHHERLRLDGPEVVVHWVAERTAPYELVASIEAAVACIVSCLGTDVGFAVLESARRRRRVGAREVKAIAARLPRAARAVLESAGSLSDTGSESLLALILTRAGIPFRQQVYIQGVGFVDFVIGDRLIVEADSKAHHSDPTRDRRRDAAASERGYRTLRFMYSQIVYDSPAVLRAIRAAIARGDHRAA